MIKAEGYIPIIIFAFIGCVAETISYFETHKGLWVVILSWVLFTLAVIGVVELWKEDKRNKKD